MRRLKQQAQGKAQEPVQEPVQQPKNGLAIAALVCGLFAMFIPIPVLDMVAGIVGIVLAVQARKSGVGGLAIAGLVVSIIGTIWATIFTITVCFLAGTGLMFF